ncbi:two-component regulator propeller domain-containing protein (plasmid) [Pseudoalteromonas espejiana]
MCYFRGSVLRDGNTIIHTRRFEKTTLPGNNFINTIYQDTDGSIWYGTDNGLAHNKNNQTLYF